ncbi:hypothetical protein [Priestia aryabhattai]|uniref:hypothetical protein n=1 Tax=Priestia aryabhattai TaxID=412384 RepID=UPI002E21A341|nr:hypothetical protein [Priestia aryabhattai]
MNTTTNFYVCCHKIGDHIFYIGSNWRGGDEKRAWSKKRRPEKWHQIVNSNGGHYTVEILEEFDNSKLARKRETELIHYYHDIGQAEASGEDHRGERNQMAGVNLNDILSEEQNKKWRENLSKARTGSNNSMYGVSLKDVISPEAYDEWRKKLSGKPSVQRKPCRVTFKGETIEFECRGHLEKYVREEYGISRNVCLKLLKTGEPYNPTHKKKKHLSGIILEFIPEEK